MAAFGVWAEQYYAPEEQSRAAAHQMWQLTGESRWHEIAYPGEHADARREVEEARAELAELRATQAADRG